MRAAVPMLLLVAGCGEAAPVAPVPVTLHTGSVLLVAVDPLGDGAWQRLPPQADVTVEVGARWLVASVCGGADYTDVFVEAYASDHDGAEVVLPCRGPVGARVPVAVAVTGGGPSTYVELGRGGGVVDGAAGTIDAYPGTWDLYAEDLGSSRIVLRRDVVVEDGAAIDVDFDADGFALEDREIRTTGAIGTVAGYAQIALSGETYATLPWRWGVPEEVVAVIPTERLREGDQQDVALDAADDVGNGQYAFVTFDGGPIEVAMPPTIREGVLRVGSAGFGATWRVDDDRERARLWARPRATDDRRYWTFGDPAAAAVGAIELPALTDIPGWDPAWNLPLDVELSATLSLTHAVDVGYVGSTWSQRFGPTAP